MIDGYVFRREIPDMIELGIIGADEAAMVGSDEMAWCRRRRNTGLMPCVGDIITGTFRWRSGGGRGYCRIASIGNYCAP